MGELAPNAAKAVDWAAWPTAAAGSEAGGAYQQTTAQVLDTPFDKLNETSQIFRDAKSSFPAQGKLEDEANIPARNQMANSAGLKAAAIQAPAAVRHDA